MAKPRVTASGASARRKIPHAAIKFAAPKESLLAGYIAGCHIGVLQVIFFATGNATFVALPVARKVASCSIALRILQLSLYHIRRAIRSPENFRI